MLLLELFDNPAQYNIKTNRNDGFVANFSADGTKYVVEINLTMPESYEAMAFIKFNPMSEPEKFDEMVAKHPSYEISFRIKNSGDYTATGTGNEYKVFSTVMGILSTVVKKMRPIELQFSSEEQSRTKLYDRMVKRLTKQYGYKDATVSDGDGHSKYYCVIRQDL